ncbi:cytochrome P450 [Actinomadura macrotermitis]|uniref:Mycinamicin IV hydroxylase/epoxidase n=1 Tax=Actinomadura macrotermitis TaxID=2585200 RepID=A0A7K0BTV5_9ACTN|nr:cytochrome P450 [Actinomadura macrotermitis]MQY04633.1 Mycinamicin IV hydroxylase/epoxidase [Actinomadura macrotermitis]
MTAEHTDRSGYTTPAPVRELWLQTPVREFTTETGDRRWLVTGMEQVRAVMADPRFSRAEARRLGAAIGPAAVFRNTGINDLDPPEHTRLRRLVAGAFSARRIRGLRPRIQQITDELIASLVAAGPPADLASGLCYPLPVTVICEILGVPGEDRQRFRGWADRVVSTGAYPPEEALGALKAMVAYMAELVDAKRRDPDESLLQDLITARDEQDRLSEDELVTLGCGLLLAGGESTATTLGKGLVALMDNPGQLALLRADPSLVPAAVDEVLRYTTLGVHPYGGHIRATTSDVDLDGTTIPAHSVVHACLPAANLDPKAFPDPERFDVTREGAADHVAFGYAMHRCLGAQLAKLELEVAIGSVLAAFPGLRLTVPAEDVPYKHGFLITGLRALPVTW